MKRFSVIRPMALLLLGGFCSYGANYSLQISDIVWSGSPGGYDCFSAAAYPNTINFTITKTANGRKDYAVTAGPSGNTGTYTRQLRSGSSVLNYQLYTTSGMNYALKAPPAAIVSEVLSGSVPGPDGQVIPLTFVFFIPPGQLVAPGTYVDQVTVSIYDAYNSVGSPQATRSIRISATVVASAAMSIVPTGGGFNSSRPQYTLNFGMLSTLQQQDCDLLVKQNSSCTVYYSSGNRGVLKQVPTPTADQISYSCLVAGSMLDLSQAGSLSLPTGISTSQDGSRYPVNITIGDVGDATAGTYEDQITITVQAQ